MNEHSSEYTQERRREIRLALQMNECQFDCDTVSAYLSNTAEASQKIISLQASTEEENFQNFIRCNSRQRLEEEYRLKLEHLVDMEKVREQEMTLHPGF